MYKALNNFISIFNGPKPSTPSLSVEPRIYFMEDAIVIQPEKEKQLHIMRERKLQSKKKQKRKIKL